MPPFANLFSRRVCALLATIIFSAAVTSARAQTETVLHDFTSFPQGFEPSNIIADVDGSLYFSTFSGGEHGNGAVIKLAQGKNGKWEQSVIYSFKGSTFNDGEIPVSLQLDGQGNIYGLTSWGGQIIKGQVCGECGTAFKLTRNSDGTWSEKVLYSFGLNDSDGWFPNANMVMDAAGNIYGSTNEGGQYQDGMVFELSPTPAGQWVETVLYTFTGKYDGNSPVAGIVADASGNLYGMTSYGGDLQCGYEGEGCGVVFQLSRTPSGSWQQQVLYAATSDNSPSGGIAIDQNGNLYGTGGSSVFEVSRSSGNTWAFKPLHQFFNPDGNSPDFLLIDGQGNIYGTAYGGGAGKSTCYYGCGTVFRLTNPGGTDSTFDVLYSFPGSSDGMDPVALAIGPSGQLYGVTQFGGQLAGTPISSNNNLPYGSGTAFSLSESSGGWSHATLATLPPGDGTAPLAGLVSDARGNLYGTTSASGPNGLGSVFELENNGNGTWSEKVIYLEGASGNLTFDASGNLYGATGPNIFRLTPSAQGSWSSAIIYKFGRSQVTGQLPNGLIVDAAGNLYGTTVQGGIGNCYDSDYFLIGCGVVFMLSENFDGTWSETILHNFAGPPYDGAAPLSSLTMGLGGELYGTTSQGGPSSCYEKGGNPPGCGAAFRLLPNGNGGWTYAILDFFEGLDGQTPSAGVSLGPDGTLYGTAPQGGLAGYGLAYKLTPSTTVPWTFTTLHNFGQTTPDGRNPAGNLSMDADGNLYGVTARGGISACNCGTVFKLSPQSTGPWTETVLHNFSGSFADGSNPVGRLLLDGQGDIFGTTSSGGEGSAPVWQFQNGGTVFEIVP